MDHRRVLLVLPFLAASACGSEPAFVMMEAGSKEAQRVFGKDERDSDTPSRAPQMDPQQEGTEPGGVAGSSSPTSEGGELGDTQSISVADTGVVSGGDSFETSGLPNLSATSYKSANASGASGVSSGTSSSGKPKGNSSVNVAVEETVGGELPPSQDTKGNGKSKGGQNKGGDSSNSADVAQCAAKLGVPAQQVRIISGNESFSVSPSQQVSALIVRMGGNLPSARIRIEAGDAASVEGPKPTFAGVCVVMRGHEGKAQIDLSGVSLTRLVVDAAGDQNALELRIGQSAAVRNLEAKLTGHASKVSVKDSSNSACDFTQEAVVHGGSEGVSCEAQ